MAHIDAKPIWRFIGKIAGSIWGLIGKITIRRVTTFLIVLGTIYAVFHVFPPGNADPLPPSSYAIVRGMGHFTSDHIIIPIEWRNSGGQPTLIRNLTLTLIDKSGSTPNLNYELAGEFANDYSKNIGYVGQSYTLKQAFVIDPNTITPTFMVFHIHDWWDPKETFQFKTAKITYKILLNYSYASFGDILGMEDSGSCSIQNIPDITIRNATVDLGDGEWDSYSTYASTRVKHWLPF